MQMTIVDRYRSISGACNNLENPEWGTAGRQMVRLLPPDYEVTFFVSVMTWKVKIKILGNVGRLSVASQDIEILIRLKKI